MKNHVINIKRSEEAIHVHYYDQYGIEKKARMIYSDLILLIELQADARQDPHNMDHLYPSRQKTKSS